MIEQGNSSPAETHDVYLRLPNLTWKQITITILLLLILGSIAWRVVTALRSQNPDPFNLGQVAAMKYQLYYPTQLPAGYHVDDKSVSVGAVAPDVVVFDLVGPSDAAKIFISEEASPSSITVRKITGSMGHLAQFKISGNEIDYGTLGGDETVSYVDGGTWLLCNTLASVPSQQIVNMAKSFKLAGQ